MDSSGRGGAKPGHTLRLIVLRHAGHRASAVLEGDTSLRVDYLRDARQREPVDTAMGAAIPRTLNQPATCGSMPPMLDWTMSEGCSRLPPNLNPNMDEQNGDAKQYVATCNLHSSPTPHALSIDNEA